MNEQTVRSWLALQCRMVPRVEQALVGSGAGAEGGFAHTLGWPEAGPPDPRLGAASLEAARLGRAVVCPAEDASHAIVACPLRVQGAVSGAIAVQVAGLVDEQREAIIRLLDWGSAWYELLVASPSAALANRLACVTGVAGLALEHSSLDASAMAGAERVARFLGCDRASVGIGNRRGARLVASTHGGGLAPDSRLARDLEAAMDEALDLGETVARPGAEPAPAHDRLAAGQAIGAACTVLLPGPDGPTGALVLERAGAEPFRNEEIELATAAAELLGPILALRREAGLGALARARAAIAGSARRVLGTEHPARVAALLGALALVAWLCTATGEYRITAPAALEGAIHRAVVAPVAGFVAAAHARAGDVVAEGDELATIDDRELRLERRRWITERAEAAKEHRRAVGKLDRAQMRILKARVGQAEARIALIDQHLARTSVRAPFDGVLVTGDLKHSVGAPVERGEVLFELAPLDDYLVTMEVPEADVADLAVGQRGRLTLAALPGERLPFLVERVVGMARAGDGGSHYRVEARLEHGGERLRPGMRGVAKVTVDERRLLWVWTHRLVERLGLALWSWLP